MSEPKGERNCGRKPFPCCTSLTSSRKGAEDATCLDDKFPEVRKMPGCRLGQHYIPDGQPAPKVGGMRLTQEASHKGLIKRSH